MKNNKEIARAMFLYISYSILGPLLVIGGIGYFVDRYLNTRFALLFSIFIAYIVSNILMFKKLKKTNKEIESIKVKKTSDDKIKIANNVYNEEDKEYNEKWPISQSNLEDDLSE